MKWRAASCKEEGEMEGVQESVVEVVEGAVVVVVVVLLLLLLLLLPPPPSLTWRCE